ncbi:MAG: HD domain-containing protein [Acidobacteria bacterium]|nr:HD domain-containing protein [Acidobacteriota bacterium]
MKSPYVSELVPNQQTTATFLVQYKEVRQKKTGESVLNLTLADRSGEVDARMWENVDKIADTFSKDDFVRVKGLPQVFSNRMQLTVHSITRVDDREVDLLDFLPASARDPEEMLAGLRAIIAGIGNEHLRGLLEAIFEDESIAGRFKLAPAAKTIHHAWLGGLIEHVLSLCGLCKLVAPHYPGIDLDLMLTGAILHDIGKIEELTYERSFNYSDVGQLLGHIHIATWIIGDKLRQVPEFPPKLRILLEHMILSHHGELEFGSPKTPMFAEAMLLHHLDNLDSKMETVRGAAAREPVAGGSFSGFIPSLDRQILRKERYLNPPPVEAAAVKAPAAEPPGQRPRQPVNNALADQLKKALSGA